MEEGRYLCICGDGEGFGNWEPSGAVKMSALKENRDEDGSGRVWALSLKVPRSLEAISYKVVHHHNSTKRKIFINAVPVFDMLQPSVGGLGGFASQSKCKLYLLHPHHHISCNLVPNLLGSSRAQRYRH